MLITIRNIVSCETYPQYLVKLLTVMTIELLYVCKYNFTGYHNQKS